MKTKILLSALLALAISLTACAPKATAVPATRQAPTAASLPTSQPKATPTKTPAPTKPAPTKTAVPTKPAATATVAVPVTGGTATAADSIVVKDQKVVNNTVTIESVTAAKAGWIVIHADQNGQPGDVIGHAAVAAGKSSDVKVTIDSSKATAKLYAMLHIDAGKIGTFEFPGADEPVKDNNTVVMTPFNMLK